ncbi:MAG: DUF5996 family protein [Acidimicrobiia bacterium]|nr:DUF5996 family protein [Acidimicrobiia bacterium]
MTATDFPALPGEYEPTRATLHAYAHAVGSVPRAHGIAHPRWWHISLKVRPEGLVTDAVPLPDGGALGLRMDLSAHEIVVRVSDGREDRLDMRAGATGTEMAGRIHAIVAEHGLAGGYDRARFENDDPRDYDPSAAAAHFDAFTKAHTVLERHRVTLGSRVGPNQVWPHGFDLAFEWFGTRTIESKGETATAQLNLGFYPAGDRYFYSAPWPFDPAFASAPLPHGALWNTDWNGAVLPYAAIQGQPDGPARVADFDRAVFDLAAPTLGA